jgi:hypothetical protein
MAVIAAVGIAIAAVAAARERRPRVSRPNTAGWQGNSSSGNRSGIADFDMKAWCEENDKHNEALQQRRRRRQGRTGR